MNEDIDEENSRDWIQFSEYFETQEGFLPTYGDSRAMMLFNYFSKGMFVQFGNSQHAKRRTICYRAFGWIFDF